MDCHRTYESLLLGAVPIVFHTSPLLTREVFLQAPTVVLKRRWQAEMGWMRKRLLSPKEEEWTRRRMGKRVAMAQYWFDVINSYRKDYKRH